MLSDFSLACRGWWKQQARVRKLREFMQQLGEGEQRDGRRQDVQLVLRLEAWSQQIQ